MRVLHFILGKADKNRANGVNQVVAGIAKYSGRVGVDVAVIGLAQSAGTEGEVVSRDGFDVIVHSRFSRNFRSQVHKAIDWADVVHLHGTFSLYNIWVGRACVARSTPYVVTVHGGLSRHRRETRGRYRKAIFHNLLQYRHLAHAAMVHALTEEEATEVLSYARPKRVVVIPNGIDLEDVEAREPQVRENGPVRVGYIGRLSFEKNLRNLCLAFSKVRECGDMELLLAGPPSSEGDAIARDFSNSRIRLVGPKFGDDKITFLTSLDLLVLPSLSEGFPIVAVEALSAGVPLLITRTSNLTYFLENDAFVMCEPTEFGLEHGLMRALSRRKDWPAMVVRGKKIIREKLNWSVVTIDLCHQYEKILE